MCLASAPCLMPIVSGSRLLVQWGSLWALTSFLGWAKDGAWALAHSRGCCGSCRPSYGWIRVWFPSVEPLAFCWGQWDRVGAAWAGLPHLEEMGGCA